MQKAELRNLEKTWRGKENTLEKLKEGLKDKVEDLASFKERVRAGSRLLRTPLAAEAPCPRVRQEGPTSSGGRRSTRCWKAYGS